MSKRFKNILLCLLFVNYAQSSLAQYNSSGYGYRSSRAEKIDEMIAITVGIAIVGALVIAALVEVKREAEKKRTQVAAAPTKETVRFSDVAGAQQAKESLSGIVDYLKDPARYSELGAKISKGVLLTGAPGNGKTLLARAVAGEAGCAFYSVSGTSLLNKYIGEGAAQVRSLFAKARATAPSIIFIDEIDGVGSKRTDSAHGNFFYESLNELLTCMDGFDQPDKPVIVIGATNRVDILDEALIRPGRFDQVVTVPNPDLKSRVEILKIYLKKIKVDLDLDIDKIARATIGFSGAQLANLVNEAAVYATRNGAKQVVLSDFEEARDRVIMGAQSKTMMISEEDRKTTAYHEAGHALVSLMLPDLLDPLHKVTITPRGQSLGVTYSLPGEKYDNTKEQFLAQITMACGGRVAEELIFGHLTTGASNDFKIATRIAHSMVCDYGMSPEIGMAVYGQKYGALTCSPAMAEKIDLAINQIIQDCYARAKLILINHRDKLDKLAQALLEKETLDASEIYELLSITPRETFKLV